MSEFPKDSKRFQRNSEGANDNVTGGCQTDAAPKNENEIYKMNAPSLEQYLAFKPANKLLKASLQPV